jgi:hypothetical protein
MRRSPSTTSWGNVNARSCAGRPNLRGRPRGFPGTPQFFSKKVACQGISCQENPVISCQGKHGSYWGLPDIRLEDDARPGPPLVDIKRSSSRARFLLAALCLVAARVCLDDRPITYCSRGRSCDSEMRR